MRDTHIGGGGAIYGVVLTSGGLAQLRSISALICSLDKVREQTPGNQIPTF